MMADDSGWTEERAEERVVPAPRHVPARAGRVNGVPTFVFNREVAMDSSQDLPTFLHALEAVGAAGMGKADGRPRFSVTQGTDL
jgi:predicted DsbA family dithiol-disulfide isomerase